MCKLEDCPYESFDLDSGYCNRHESEFERRESNHNILKLDLLYTCDCSRNCNNPVMESGLPCSDHGGVTSTHRLLKQATKTLAPIKDFFKNSSGDTDGVIIRTFARSYARDPNVTLLQVLNSAIVSVDSCDIENLDSIIKDLVQKLNTNGGTNMASSKFGINTEKLKNNGKKMLVRKAARKLLNSRLHVVKLLTKANIVKEDTALYLNGLLQSELGEMAWGFVVTALASYLPQIPVAEKYKGLQEQLVDELQIQTMDTGSDKILGLATMLFENLFSDDLEEEPIAQHAQEAEKPSAQAEPTTSKRRSRKPAALPAESVQKAAKIDLSSLAEETVTVSPSSRKSNR